MKINIHWHYVQLYIIQLQTLSGTLGRKLCCIGTGQNYKDLSGQGARASFDGDNARIFPDKVCGMKHNVNLFNFTLVDDRACGCEYA